MTRHRKLEAHVVSHTHWDRAWYWTFEETRLRLVDLLDDLLALLERDGRYRHFVLDGQLAMVLDYLELRPKAAPRVASLVRAGRLSLGPFFVLPDLFIPRGESLVRNLRLGREAAAPLGPTMALGYLPDPFGLPAQLPQILRGFGIGGVFLSRGVGDEGERLGADFRWRAPDGSEVLATHQLGGGYCNLARLGDGLAGEAASEAACARIRRVARELSRACPSGVLLLSNGCDHLAAQPELPALLAAVRRRLGHELRLRHSTPVAYQRAVRRAIAAGRFRPGLHEGELRGSRYANLLPGVLSSRVDLKLALDQTERELLHWAEPFSAAASFLAGCARDDRAALAHAWRLLLLCLPHDDVCGCSIDAVHDDDRNRLARALQVARQVTVRALQALASRAAPAPAGAVAFNPHPFAVDACVELAAWRAAVAGPDGPLASQRTATGTLVRVALPPLGWTTLSPVRRAGGGGDEVRARGRTLANGQLRVRVSRAGAVLLEPLDGSRARHRLELVDEADAGDSYDFSPVPGERELVGFARPPRLRLLERGPLRAVIALDGTLALPASLDRFRRRRAAGTRQVQVRLRVSLEAGSTLCALALEVENTALEHRLRLRLRSSLDAKELVAGAPFEVARRPLAAPARVRGWVQRPASTVPLEGFAALEHGAAGVALLAPGLHELEGRRRGRAAELSLTLLRSVCWLSRADLRTRRGHAGPGLPVEGARQLGLHRFRIGVLCYAGGWATSVPRATRLHASPPRVVDASPGAGPTLEPTGSLLSLEPASVELASLEPGARPGSLLVRLVNLERRPLSARLSGAFRRARRLRLDGSAAPGRVNLDALALRPAEICTLLLER